MLVEQLEVFGQHHQLCLRDDDEVLEVVGGPNDLLHDRAFGKAELLEDFARRQVVEEDRIICMDNDLSHWCRIYHLNSDQSLLVERHLFDVRSRLFVC